MTQEPVDMFQILAVQSALPVSTLVPSGENATERTPSVYPMGWVNTLSRPLGPQSNAVLSKVPVTTLSPSGENAIDKTGLLSWARVLIQVPVAVLHTVACPP